MSPQVSVLMSVYNGAHFLPQSIESVLKQTFSDFEFLIINDASTDGSLDIIKKYQKQDKRIKIIANKKNLGLTKSLNKGLRLARGKYIARLDADDFCSKKRLEKQFNFLESHSDTFLVASWASIIDKKNNVLGIKEILTGTKAIRKKLEKHNCLFHSSIMFRNHYDLKYREKFIYAQDYDLYLRLLTEKKKISVIPKPLIFYRIDNKSISAQKKKQQLLFAQKAKEFYQQRKKQKKDEYNKFNEQEILTTKPDKTSSIKSEIVLMLKLGKFKKAEKLYQGYQKKEKSWFRKMFFSLPIKCPSLYKIYYHLRYGK